jgi:hypothetical protein
MITQQRLHELFEYRDGTLIRKVGRNVGKVAGTFDRSKGYFRLTTDRNNNIHHYVHRLIFIYHNGNLTEGFQIDHIDGDRTNNRIENLREATGSQNMQNAKIPSNNKSGVKGVSWHKIYKKWQVYIMIKGKRLFFGRYDTLEEATAVAEKARNELHGDFARHN